MGSENHYPEEALLRPGSLVFHKTEGPVDLRDVTQWWLYVPGAHWRAPHGSGSSVTRLGDHPVTHVVAEDAEAYATWAGEELPSEAEWEYAARGGLDGAIFVWGEDFVPGGRMMANTWQGEFPWQNLKADAWAETSPVKTFPANGYGLFDMAGNEGTNTISPPAEPVRFRTPVAPRATRGSLPRRQAGQPASPAGTSQPRDQGRLPPVRPELLPALPARGPPT